MLSKFIHILLFVRENIQMWIEKQLLLKVRVYRMICRIKSYL